MGVVRIDPEIMSGEPCFPGTRVPVEILVDFFLGQHPTVSREKAEACLQASADLAVRRVSRTSLDSRREASVARGFDLGERLSR